MAASLIRVVDSRGMDITPSAEETSHSQILANKIKAEILANNGQISFAKYMEMALYTPGLGYYAAGAAKFGKQGDFVTAPEISPLFGATIVQTILPALSHLQQESLPLQILEFGAGSGALAESVLDALEKLDFKIDSYNILDLSADLIERQKQRLSQRAEKINWLSELPETKSEQNATEQFVFCDGVKVENDLLPTQLGKEIFAEGYTTEIHPNGNAWINSLAKILKKGLLLTFDYGFPAHEYYHSQRGQGTVMGHYRHHAIQDPFFYPGLCDLTAHVEWSTITQSAIDHGFDFLGYTSQASYLLNAGIGELALSYADPRDAVSFMPISNGLQKLLSEAEMGELFKALCLGKDMPFSEGDLPGFQSKPRAL
ncbi:MAG: hypothetical protein RIR85_1222 [Pseudomonadota bacterium]